MKDFNDAIANMSKEELDMAIREQDNKALQVISEAVTQQQEVSLGHDKLITALEKTLYQVVEVFQQDRKETRAKLEVLAASLDRLEVQLGNRREGSRNKPNLDTQLQDIVNEAITVSEAKEETERVMAEMEEVLGLDKDELNELKKAVYGVELEEEDIDERD